MYYWRISTFEQHHTFPITTTTTMISIKPQEVFSMFLGARWWCVWSGQTNYAVSSILWRHRVENALPSTGVHENLSESSSWRHADNDQTNLEEYLRDRSILQANAVATLITYYSYSSDELRNLVNKLPLGQIDKWPKTLVNLPLEGFHTSSDLSWKPRPKEISLSLYRLQRSTDRNVPWATLSINFMFHL